MIIIVLFLIIGIMLHYYLFFHILLLLTFIVFHYKIIYDFLLFFFIFLILSSLTFLFLMNKIISKYFQNRHYFLNYFRVILLININHFIHKVVYYFDKTLWITLSLASISHDQSPYRMVEIIFTCYKLL